MVIAVKWKVVTILFFSGARAEDKQRQGRHFLLIFKFEGKFSIVWLHFLCGLVLFYQLSNFLISFVDRDALVKKY